MALVKPLQCGTLAFVLLLIVYFGLVSLISGRNFALEQFSAFWYFIVTLVLGFGGIIREVRSSHGNRSGLRHDGFT